MSRFMDQTVRVETPGQLEIAPDGDVHVTWIEDGVSLTLIVPMDEARRLSDDLDRQRAEASSARR